MAPTLYMVDPSPPSRAVLIIAKALGIELNIKLLDFPNKEQFSPAFLKINPQHTVPTLVEEDGFIVWDSHAINAYLVSKYAKNDALYPKDPKKRALIDQRLHFDTGVIFATLANTVKPILRQTKKGINSDDVASFNEVYAFLDAFLDGNKAWIAGEELSIADYNIYTSVTALSVGVALDEKKYPRLAAWLKKVDALPEVQVSKKGHAMFEAFFKRIAQLL